MTAWREIAGFHEAALIRKISASRACRRGRLQLLNRREQQCAAISHSRRDVELSQSEYAVVRRLACLAHAEELMRAAAGSRRGIEYCQCGKRERGG
jgi:hypothetical protein